MPTESAVTALRNEIDARPDPADTAGGDSRVILTSAAGVYYTVLGWLDDQTLLVQSSEPKCDPNCLNGLWTVGSTERRQ